jgi:hypothetical protein
MAKKRTAMQTIRRILGIGGGKSKAGGGGG